MVAPKYGSPEPFSTGAAQDAASTRNDKRREEILLRLISDANEDRMEGNALFKDRSFDDALAKYSKAIHTLQKLPKKMASKDMAKALNNRGRAYVKLALMTLAEADASEVLSMGTVEPASKAAAFLVRYHARVGLGAKQKAAQDLNRSADLGNMDAQKMLLLPSAKKGKTNGGFQGACSSDDPPRTGVVAQGGIGGGGSFSTQPGALKPSTASVDVSVSAMAAGKGPGASADVKLKARPDAGAGEELTFGGPRGCSSWGQHPVPEVGGSPPRSRSPQRSQEGGNAVAATGLPVAGENAATPTRRIEAAGYAKDPDDVGGANGTGGVCDGRGEGGGGSGDACTTTNFLEVPRRRRPRPGSPGKGNVTTVSFTPSVPMTAAGEDTFPAPHPVLAHASVRRCFVLAPTGDGGSSGGTIVDGGEAVATVGDTESDSVGKVSSSGIGDAVSDVVLGAGRQGVGFNRELGPGQGLRGTPGCRESGGEGAGSRAGDEQGSRREGEGRVGGGGGDDKIGGRKGKNGAPAVGLVEGENEGPPPAKQAQDIRWLVAQAKEEPREGDVWAVVDRQWWLRWQRFTGCEEGAASGEDAEETAHAAAEDADAQSSAAVAAAAVAAASADAAPGQEDIRSAAPAGVDVEVESGGRRRNEVDAGDGGGGGGGSGDVARESDSSPREGKQANDNNNENSIGGGRTSEEGVHPSSSLEAVVSSATVGIGASPENSGDVVEVGDRGVGGQSHRVTAGGREAAGGEMTDCEKRSDSFVTPDASGEIAKASAAIAAEDLRKTGGSDGGGGGVSGSGGGGDSSVPLNGVAGTNGELKGAASATATATAATTTAAIASSSSAEAAALSALVAKAEAAAVAAVAAPAVAATAVPPPLRAPPPGPINNSALVMSARTPGTVPGSGRRLRLHLVRGYHFVLVPQEAWKALHAWYGGGPALPRSLVPVRDSESGRFVCEPQLYPEFSLLDPELQRSLASSSAAVPRDTARPEFKEASTSSSSSSSSPYASSFTSSSSSSCSSSSSSSPSSSSHRQPPPAKQLAKSVDTGGGEGSRDGCGGGGSTATTTTTSTSLNGSLPAAPIHDPPSEPTIEKGEGFVEAKGGEQAADGVGSERREERRREETPHPPAAAAAVAAAAAAAAGQRSCAACGRPARAKCNACLKNSHKVFYCSKECQSAHWRFHKQLCGGSRSDPEAGLAMAKRGKAGLANLGNTCFLSSAVQCLSHVQPLTRHILTNAFLRDLNTTNPLGTGGRLVRAYETVLKDLWFGSGKTVSPAALKSAIAQFAPQFNGFSQQDSQEVLSFLLDGLHEDLNRVLKKPYLILPDGECGRPDAVIAAQSWEMFKMRDRSVLVDSLYGQFKSTLECPQCGKLSRKFDEFNVMPVELLDGQRLHVLLDFAPFLAPSKIAVSGNNGTPSAATILGGLGAEGRRQRRIGVLLPKGARVSDLKEELSAMFKIGLDEMVIVVVPVSGQTIYRLLPDSAEVLPFTQGYDITAHQCVPGQRHALVVNRVFHGGSFVTFSEEMLGRFSPADWTKELDSLARLKYEDKEAPFLVSFPEGISCLRLIKEVWMHTPDLFHLLKERVEDPSFVHVLASTGHVKLSEASNSFAPRFARMDHNQAQRQAKLDEENGVVVTNTGRYVPPFENIPAAAVLDTRGARREGLDFFHLDWSGLMLQNMNRERISEPFAARDHVSVQETAQRAKRVSLQDCLQKFSVPETLCEDNSWHCGNCKELRQAVKTIQVWSLPEVLILHFKRFSHVGPNRGKVELFVDFPINGLDMSSYCRGETLEGGRPMSALYDLFAVSNHMGDMAHGHYTAYVRDWEGGGMSDKWYVCDDEDCLPVDESRVRTQHAYVLFYRRRPLA